MAATRMFSMHQNKSKSIAQCLTDRTDYAKKPIRFRSLGEGYSEDDIRTAIKGIKPFTPKRKPTQKPVQRFSLLVDIQAKLRGCFHNVWLYRNAMGRKL